MINWLPFGRRRDKQSAAAGRGAGRARRGPDPIGDALSDREAETVIGEIRAFTRSGGEIGPDEAARLAARVSAKALALIIRHETGGREYYENVYKSRPVWPEASSGVTIGFGYDLGYQKSIAAVAKDWSDVLPAAHVQMMEPAVGLAAVEPDRDEKIALIEEVVESLVGAGVTIPWSAAETVFQRTTVPRFAAITAEALPGHEGLTSDCFGALVSLTFNRGPSYSKAHNPEKDPKDRYREMRGIRQALAEGEIERIPGLIRAMKRIWKGTPIEGEMNRRRENEARLFEEGIPEIVVASLDEATGGPVVRSRAATRSTAPVDEAFISTAATDEADEEAHLQRRTRDRDFSFEVRRAAPRIRWASDAEAPDYAHLANKLPAGASFTLTADDLALLAELNSFPVEEAGSRPVLFGLRGCGIEDAEDTFDKEVRLVDQRPDHRSTRCVIGVWDRAQRRIAVFPASTVPHADAVTSWYQSRSSGNMLASGFYRYIVGTHNGRPGCFVLRDTDDEKWTVFVRRSSNNMMYERVDTVDECAPGDNLHPTFGSGPDWFSSFGCQVVLGKADTSGNHSGPWAKFRRLAGLTTATGKPRTPYVYILLTGLEAMLAARARANDAARVPEVRQSLERLRFGSKGEKVSRLQKALQVPVTGEYDLDTARAVYKLQAARWGKACDGIFTPALEAELNLAVFSAPAPGGPAVATIEPAPPPAVQPAPAQQPAPQPQPAPIGEPTAQQPPAPAPQVSTAPPPKPAAPPAQAAAQPAAPAPTPAAPQTAPRPTQSEATPAQAAALAALAQQAAAEQAAQSRGGAAPAPAQPPPALDGKALAAMAATIATAAAKRDEEKKPTPPKS